MYPPNFSLENASVPVPEHGQSNLTPSQQKALTNLIANTTLVIKPSDKGDNIVVMDMEQYQCMCMKLLLNKKWYKPISTARIPTINDNFYQLVEFERLIYFFIL